MYPINSITCINQQNSSPIVIALNQNEETDNHSYTEIYLVFWLVVRVLKPSLDKLIKILFLLYKSIKLVLR